MEHPRYFFPSRMRMDQAWVRKRHSHYLLRRNDFSVTQCQRAQLLHLAGSAALVLGSVLVSASFRFGGFGSAGKVET